MASASFYFIAEITDRAFQFRVPEEKLNRPDIALLGTCCDELYKRPRLMGDIDTIIADSADLIAAHGIDLETVCDVLAQDMVSAG